MLHHSMYLVHILALSAYMPGYTSSFLWQTSHYAVPWSNRNLREGFFKRFERVSRLKIKKVLSISVPRILSKVKHDGRDLCEWDLNV